MNYKLSFADSIATELYQKAEHSWVAFSRTIRRQLEQNRYPWYILNGRISLSPSGSSPQSPSTSIFTIRNFSCPWRCSSHSHALFQVWREPSCCYWPVALRTLALISNSGNAFSVSHITENIETGCFSDFWGGNGGHCGGWRGIVVGVGMVIDWSGSSGGRYNWTGSQNIWGKPKRRWAAYLIGRR